MQAEEIYSREFDVILFKLPPHIRENIERKITELGGKLRQYPHHRLKGNDNFRLRVGDYRIIYGFDLEHNILYLIAMGHRRDIYK